MVRAPGEATTGPTAEATAGCYSRSCPQKQALSVDGPFNSDIFLPFYVQVFSEPSLKGLHRRHPLILGVGGDVEAFLGLHRIFK